MRLTTWAALGSLFINMVLGLTVAALFSAAPVAGAAEPAHCTGQAVHSANTTVRSTAPQPSYLVAARMGWAVG